jgi:hypothetical protein
VSQAGLSDRRSARSRSGPEIRRMSYIRLVRLTWAWEQVHSYTWSQLKRPGCLNRSSCTAVAPLCLAAQLAKKQNPSMSNLLLGPTGPPTSSVTTSGA